MRTIYRVGDLKRVIKESATKSEFKPVYGSGVQDDSKKINRQAYKDIEKETSAYDGGLSKQKPKKGTAVTPELNRGMSDLQYDSISQPFKDKVKAQLKGYTSAEEEKNHKGEELGNASYDPNDLTSDIAKHAKDVKKENDKVKGTGLTGSTQNKSDIENRNDTMFESKKIKNIKFKHTEFLSEGHMLTKVPDEFKNEGNKFIMSDSEGNSYLVEWHNDEKPDVEKRINKKLVNEEINRIKNLYNYHSKDFFNTTTSQSRLKEDKEISQMLGRARQLMK